MLSNVANSMTFAAHIALRLAPPRACRYCGPLPAGFVASCGGDHRARPHHAYTNYVCSRNRSCTGRSHSTGPARDRCAAVQRPVLDHRRAAAAVLLVPWVAVFARPIKRCSRCCCAAYRWARAGAPASNSASAALRRRGSARSCSPARNSRGRMLGDVWFIAHVGSVACRVFGAGGTHR